MRTQPELEAALEHVQQAPKDTGTIELIARRPAIGTREVIARALPSHARRRR